MLRGFQEDVGLPVESQHRFIAFADFLPHRGVEALVVDVQRMVSDQVGR